MAHELKKAFEKGLTTPTQKKAQDEKIKKERLERAKKEFLTRFVPGGDILDLKSKKKVYANEHPKYRGNNKQD